MKEFSSQLQGSNFRGVQLKETQPTRTLPLPDVTTESAVRSRVVTNFIYLFTIFKQACPVQHGWFKWRPVKNSIIQIN